MFSRLNFIFYSSVSLLTIFLLIITIYNNIQIINKSILVLKIQAIQRNKHPLLTCSHCVSFPEKPVFGLSCNSQDICLVFSCIHLQDPQISLVAQMVKNLPAMWDTWVWSVDWEDALEEGMAIHSSILAWRIAMDRGAWWAAERGVSKSRTRLSN